MRAARATPARLAALALALAACAGCSTGSGAASNAARRVALRHRERRDHHAPDQHTVAHHIRIGRPLAVARPRPHPRPRCRRRWPSARTTVDGTAFAGAELAGKKTVLWFWAPWCTVCARAAAGVKDAATALGPDVRVVGVAGLSTDAADMRRFVDRGGLQALTNLADTTGDLYARFGITQQDTFVLIGPDGTVSRHPAYSQDVDLVALARQTFG